MTTFCAPGRQTYDVVIVGGAIYGSAVAWFLTDSPDFDGTILVVEMDPTYQFASTTLTNSCLRQQFSRELNVCISQFAAQFIKNFRDALGGDVRVPQIPLRSFGYLYLADTQARAHTLKAAQAVQVACGAGTRFLTAEEIKRAYPFYQVEDILGGTHNQIDEGYFDGATLFDWWKRSARERGVDYCPNRVVALDKNASGNRVERVRLATGEVIACGTLVNASGPRAAATCRMAGIDIPVEPRKRFTFIFDAERSLDRDLPLTIDPSGVHFRSDGQFYLAGCPPEVDNPVAYDDFAMDHHIWEARVWPTIAHRIPQFDALKLTNSWAGHYAYNTFDQNAIVGPHPGVQNFLFVNGFSGHGLQQSPALGRGTAEWIVHGRYRSLDLTPFHFDRIKRGEPFVEEAVI